MGHFFKEGFDHFKSILHPNLRANADHYYDNGMYHFPAYHGCGLRNRNGTNKLIDYKRIINAFSLLIKNIGNLILKFLKIKLDKTLSIQGT